MTALRHAGYIPPLDGLRGIAILVVMLHHFTQYRPTEGIDHLIGSVVFFGWTGVDLFFVLSGFLITGILLDTRNSERYFTTFYARRILRIVPLYYVVLFVAFFVVPIFPEVNLALSAQERLPPHWPYWLFLSNVAIAKNDWAHGWVDVSWSLAIEEHFYLVWPLVIWLCPPRVVALLCAAIVVGEGAARVAARWSEDMKPLPLFVLTWYRLDGLAMGALVALAQRRGLLPKLDRWVPLVLILVVAGIIGCVKLGGHTWWWNRWMQMFGYSLIVIGAGALLVSAINRPAGSLWVRLLSAGWLRAFGKYSYALYLTHTVVMLAVIKYVFNPEEHRTRFPGWIGEAQFYVVATALSFAVAWLSWRLLEAPILRLKARFAY